ncbi:MAG: radical SAM protein, partial [Lachnospiraceae bacterium]|nr:radical SAM protein [Lachnospiraceae bacterium]
LRDVARQVNSSWPAVRIRINTNGLGSLSHGKNIAPLFEGLIDIVSISLNTPDAARYLELTRSKFGIGSFPAMLDFARECAKYVPEVVMSTVSTTITPEEEQKCAEICKQVGAVYRIRPFE